MRFAIIGLVFFFAVGTLLYVSIREGAIPVLRIDQIRGSDYQGGECRVDDGKLAAIKRQVDPLRFVVQSEAGGTLIVESRRHPPDNFKIGNPVGLRGFYDRDRNVFVASHITTACPTKYEPGGPGGAPPAQYGTSAPAGDRS